MRFRFSEFELDDGRFLLSRGGETVAVQPKPLRLLQTLLRRSPNAVSKQELAETLWPGVRVTPDSLTRAARALRRALGERAATGEIVQTVRGRGYRIAVPVERLGEDDATGAPAGSAAPGPHRFVGREDTLSELEGALAQASRDVGGIACLVGEPGIGKTRTAEELTRRAEPRGFEVHWGRGIEGEGAEALWPWVQILRSAMRTRDAHELVSTLGAGAADVASLVPELRALLPAPRRKAAENRLRFFDAVVGFLKAIGETRPQLIVLDDLHYADVTTLQLLVFAARELGDARVLLVGTYRDVAAPENEALEDARAELARLPRSARLTLAGFTPDEVRAFFESRIRSTLDDAAIARALERTGGNPFFLGELCRNGAGIEEASSTGVHDVLRKRVRALSEETQDALRAAAVLGRSAPCGWLAHMLGRSQTDVLDSLEEAERAGLVRMPAHEPEPIFQFAHALAQDSVYARLPRSRRARLHRAAAEAIEALQAADLDPWLALLAHHFRQALATGAGQPAIDYAIRAGDAAARRLAFEDAATSYREAVGMMESHAYTDRRRMCEVLLSLAQAEADSGDRTAMRATCLRVLELARALDAAESFASATLLLGRTSIAYMVTDERAIALLEEALERLGSGSPALRARVLGQLAAQLSFANDPRRAELRDEARRIAAELGDERLFFEVYGEEKGMEHWLPLAEERVRQASRLGARGLGARGLGAQARFDALLNRGTVRLYQGDVGGLAEDLDAAEALAQAVGGWRSKYWPMMGRASLALLQGRLEDGQQLARQALEIGAPAFGEAWPTFGMQMLVIFLHRGILRSSRVYEERVPDSDDPWSPTLIARMYMGEDARDEVERRFEAIARHDFDDVPVNPVFVAEHWEYAWPSTMSFLAEMCVYLGDTRRAALLYERMLPNARFHGVLGDYASVSLGPISLRLGMLATLLGRLPEAEGHFVSAKDWAERAGARPWLAHTLVEGARMLLARAASGDPRRALEWADAALGLAREMDMKGVERDASDLKRSAR